MEIMTKYFGEIEIDEEDIIKFPEGLPGFQEEKSFIILNSQEEDNPFQWLQSVKNKNLAFFILNPFLIKKDYEIKLSDSTIKKLKIENQEDVSIYTVVTVPDDIKKMTVNLAGPIVINIREKLGKQIVLDDNRYSTKYYIYPQKVQHEGAE